MGEGVRRTDEGKGVGLGEDVRRTGEGQRVKTNLCACVTPGRNVGGNQSPFAGSAQLDCVNNSVELALNIFDSLPIAALLL